LTQPDTSRQFGVPKVQKIFCQTSENRASAKERLAPACRSEWSSFVFRSYFLASRMGFVSVGKMWTTEDGSKINQGKTILPKKISLRHNPLTINNLRQIHTMEKIIVDTLRNIPASWGVGRDIPSSPRRKAPGPAKSA
jgi:hypothetical protein